MSYIYVDFEKVKYSREPDWVKVKSLLATSCHCVDLDTDLSNYIHLNGFEEPCFDGLATYLRDMGWVGEVKTMAEVMRLREERRKHRERSRKKLGKPLTWKELYENTFELCQELLTSSLKMWEFGDLGDKKKHEAVGMTEAEFESYCEEENNLIGILYNQHIENLKEKVGLQTNIVFENKGYQVETDFQFISDYNDYPTLIVVFGDREDLSLLELYIEQENMLFPSYSCEFFLRKRELRVENYNETKEFYSFLDKIPPKDILYKDSTIGDRE